MPLYEYKAYNSKGKTVKGLIEAASESLAFEKIKQKNLYPHELSEEKGKTPSIWLFGQNEALAFALTQLSALIKAGLPLPQALETLSLQLENENLSRAFTRAKVRLGEGESFASALAEDKIFPPLLVHMVEAGESVGLIETILEKFADSLEKTISFQKKILSALIYPSVVIVASLGLILFILTYIAPTLVEIFEGFKKALPLTTRILLVIGNSLRNYFYIWIILIIGAIIAYWKLVPYAFKEKLTNKVPLLGQLRQQIMLSRWARTLAMLHGGGVSLVKALESAREVIDNITFREKFSKIKEKVEKGQSLGEAMEIEGVFPPLLVQMIQTGEKTAELEKMLSTVADFYEKETERKLTTTVQLLEPIMILFLGLVVGFVAISVLLPIFEINKMIR